MTPLTLKSQSSLQIIVVKKQLESSNILYQKKKKRAKIYVSDLIVIYPSSV